jgi:hypothetical protein
MAKFKKGDILATTTADGDMLGVVEEREGQLFWRFSYRNADCVFRIYEDNEQEYVKVPSSQFAGQSLYDVVGSYMDTDHSLTRWLTTQSHSDRFGKLLTREHFETTHKFCVAAAARYKAQLENLGHMTEEEAEEEFGECVGSEGPCEDAEDLIDMFQELSDEEKAFLHDESVYLRDLHECMVEWMDC